MDLVTLKLGLDSLILCDVVDLDHLAECYSESFLRRMVDDYRFGSWPIDM